MKSVDMTCYKPFAINYYSYIPVGDYACMIAFWEGIWICDYYLHCKVIYNV